MSKRILSMLLAGIVTLLCLSAGAEGVSAGATAPDDASTTESPADEAPQPARGYVLVSTATQTGWLPLPEEGEYTYDLRQVMPDGTEALNVIHLTSEGVYMEDSTCENHDCVDQGTVTLENRNDRILSNMIICLPNQVWLQLLTPEEILEMIGTEAEADMKAPETEGDMDAPAP